MKYLITALLVTLFATTGIAQAANTLTTNVKVSRIDTTRVGEIRVQTDPRPNIPGGCSSSFWLILKRDSEENYEEMYAILLAAKVANLTISVGADDNNAPSNSITTCDLSRVILE